MSEENSSKFTFIPKSFDSIDGKDNKDFLLKWGMRGKLKTYTFTFDKQFHLGKKDQFILEFFQDEKIISSLQKQGKNGVWNNLGVKATKVNVEDVDCTQLSVEIFDKFSADQKVVRESGLIRKCLDEYYENIVISDELRKVLLLEESDNYEIYSDKERNEFIFRLFKHLAIGGEVCQYEDKIEAYIDVTKSIYKDLISVQKDPQTKKLKIVSFVYRVEAFEEKTKIYPNNTIDDQDFCYLIIDPFKRHIIVLYHKFDGAIALD